MGEFLIVAGIIGFVCWLASNDDSSTDDVIRSYEVIETNKDRIEQIHQKHRAICGESRTFGFTDDEKIQNRQKRKGTLKECRDMLDVLDENMKG